MEGNYYVPCEWTCGGQTKTISSRHRLLNQFISPRGPNDPSLRLFLADIPTEHRPSSTIRVFIGAEVHPWHLHSFILIIYYFACTAGFRLVSLCLNSPSPSSCLSKLYSRGSEILINVKKVSTACFIEPLKVLDHFADVVPRFLSPVFLREPINFIQSQRTLSIMYNN